MRGRSFARLAALMAATSLAVAAADTPDFGPNVLLLDPAMPGLQGRLDAIYQKQERSQFGPDRFVYLFRPGTYPLDVQLGFYMQASSEVGPVARRRLDRRLGPVPGPLDEEPECDVQLLAERGKSLDHADRRRANRHLGGFSRYGAPASACERESFAVGRGLGERRFHGRLPD